MRCPSHVTEPSNYAVPNKSQLRREITANPTKPLQSQHPETLLHPDLAGQGTGLAVLQLEPLLAETWGCLVLEPQTLNP